VAVRHLDRVVEEPLLAVVIHPLQIMFTKVVVHLQVEVVHQEPQALLLPVAALRLHLLKEERGYLRLGPQVLLVGSVLQQLLRNPP
jgi:hypothetical protein